MIFKYYKYIYVYLSLYNQLPLEMLWPPLQTTSSRTNSLICVCMWFNYVHLSQDNISHKNLQKLDEFYGSNTYKTVSMFFTFQRGKNTGTGRNKEMHVKVWGGVAGHHSHSDTLTIIIPFFLKSYFSRHSNLSWVQIYTCRVSHVSSSTFYWPYVLPQ